MQFWRRIIQMNEKKNSIDDILDELNFTDDEKSVFKRSIEYTKLEQANEEIDAKDQIFTCVKELIKHEV